MSRDLLSEEDARIALPSVARHGFARLVAARHAIWRLRRSGSQPAQGTNDHEQTNHLYVFLYSICLSCASVCSVSFNPLPVSINQQESKLKIIPVVASNQISLIFFFNININQFSALPSMLTFITSTYSTLLPAQ